MTAPLPKAVKEARALARREDFNGMITGAMERVVKAADSELTDIIVNELSKIKKQAHPTERMSWEDIRQIEWLTKSLDHISKILTNAHVMANPAPSTLINVNAAPGMSEEELGKLMGIITSEEKPRARVSAK